MHLVDKMLSLHRKEKRFLSLQRMVVVKSQVLPFSHTTLGSYNVSADASQKLVGEC